MKKLQKKLVLGRETIAALEARQLASAAGAWGTTSWGPRCTASQGNNCNCTMDESSCATCPY